MFCYRDYQLTIRYNIFESYNISEYGRPFDKGNSVLLHFETHEECCTFLGQFSNYLYNNQFDITVFKEVMLLTTYLQDRNVRQKKKDQLTKRDKVGFRKEKKWEKIVNNVKKLHMKTVKDHNKQNQHVKRGVMLLLRIGSIVEETKEK